MFRIQFIDRRFPREKLNIKKSNSKQNFFKTIFGVRISTDIRSHLVVFSLLVVAVALIIVGVVLGRVTLVEAMTCAVVVVPGL